MGHVATAARSWAYNKAWLEIMICLLKWNQYNQISKAAKIIQISKKQLGVINRK